MHHTRNALLATVALCAGCSEILSDYTFYDPDAGRDGAAQTFDAGTDAGTDGAVDAGAVDDAGADAGCTATLGTLENCTACGDRCGWVCGEAGCNDAISLTATMAHTCAARQDGTVACWGSNPYGHLGAGSTEEFESLPQTVIDLRGALEVSSGYGVSDIHTCARTDDGTVRCWGLNVFGQLGDGTTVNRTSPVPVEGLSGVSRIDVGQFIACAIVDGAVWCWGSGYGSVPVEIAGVSNVVDVDVGGGHTCVVESGGDAYCWGLNTAGQLGDGTFDDRSAPVRVGGLEEVSAIAAGSGRTCALSRAGSVRCWGAGYGVSPIAVSGLGVATDISVGDRHACAVLQDTSVRCWGSNEAGQLGDGSTGGESLSPVTVLGVTGATSVVAGGAHTCAIVAGGVRCWGDNAEGKLGDGTTTNRAAPISVIPPE